MVFNFSKLCREKSDNDRNNYKKWSEKYLDKCIKQQSKYEMKYIADGYAYPTVLFDSEYPCRYMAHLDIVPYLSNYNDFDLGVYMSNHCDEVRNKFYNELKSLGLQNFEIKKKFFKKCHLTLIPKN